MELKNNFIFSMFNHGVLVKSYPWRILPGGGRGYSQKPRSTTELPAEIIEQ